jgi:hypothetical protein
MKCQAVGGPVRDPKLAVHRSGGLSFSRDVFNGFGQCG